MGQVYVCLHYNGEAATYILSSGTHHEGHPGLEEFIGSIEVHFPVATFVVVPKFTLLLFTFSLQDHCNLLYHTYITDLKWDLCIIPTSLPHKSCPPPLNFPYHPIAYYSVDMLLCRAPSVFRIQTCFIGCLRESLCVYPNLVYPNLASDSSVNVTSKVYISTLPG